MTIVVTEKGARGMKIGDKVHCTKYVERTGQGISVLDFGELSMRNGEPWGKQVCYFDAEKKEMCSIPYEEFTDVTVDKFMTSNTEFDGIYVGTTRLATKLTATYETPPYGNDYIRFESECYKPFAVVYYANNRKRLVPIECVSERSEKCSSN
jgi:hypothetical protein